MNRSSPLICRIRGLARRTDGLAAIEFALIAPILIMMFFGLIEISNGLMCRQQVGTMASSAADLVAQAQQITNNDRDNVFAATAAIMYPNSTTSLSMVISSVVDDGHGGGKVAWSDAKNGSARAIGSTVAVPTGLIPAGGSVILAEVTYTYVSKASVEITGPITISRSAYSQPRLSTQVARVP